MGEKLNGASISMQSKKLSHLEALINQIVGIVVGWCIVYFVFPLFDYLPQGQVATISTIIFFVASYLRIYAIRRMFNGLSK